MTFTQYLQQKKYSVLTIRSYTLYIDRFLTWLNNENLQAGSFTYNDLLEFMRWCQGQGVTKRTVHNILGVIRHWCNYQIVEGKRTDNPAAGVFIKGLVRKLPTNLLSMEELEELYQQYSVQLNVDGSKKIMFGLMVYQGLDTGDLMRVEMKDIKLREGKIKIRATKRTNERIMSLHAKQVMILQQYLTENKFKEACLPDRQGALFIEARKKQVSERNINNRIKYMFSQLKQLNSKVASASQVRSSVITHWLRQNNLRQVQYLAGHKYVSSTQRYQISNLDDLQNELQHHHPMS